jgi:hypothetical protein
VSISGDDQSEQICKLDKHQDTFDKKLKAKTASLNPHSSQLASTANSSKSTVYKAVPVTRMSTRGHKVCLIASPVKLNTSGKFRNDKAVSKLRSHEPKRSQEKSLSSSAQKSTDKCTKQNVGINSNKTNSLSGRHGKAVTSTVKNDKKQTSSEAVIIRPAVQSKCDRATLSEGNKSKNKLEPIPSTSKCIEGTGLC